MTYISEIEVPEERILGHIVVRRNHFGLTGNVACRRKCNACTLRAVSELSDGGNLGPIWTVWIFKTRNTKWTPRCHAKASLHIEFALLPHSITILTFFLFTAFRLRAIIQNAFLKTPKYQTLFLLWKYSLNSNLREFSQIPPFFTRSVQFMSLKISKTAKSRSLRIHKIPAIFRLYERQKPLATVSSSICTTLDPTIAWTCFLRIRSSPDIRCTLRNSLPVKFENRIRSH